MSKKPTNATELAEGVARAEAQLADISARLSKAEADLRAAYTSALDGDKATKAVTGKLRSEVDELRSLADAARTRVDEWTAACREAIESEARANLESIRRRWAAFREKSGSGRVEAAGLLGEAAAVLDAAVPESSGVQVLNDLLNLVFGPIGRFRAEEPRSENNPDAMATHKPLADSLLDAAVSAMEKRGRKAKSLAGEWAEIRAADQATTIPANLADPQSAEGRKEVERVLDVAFRQHLAAARERVQGGEPAQEPNPRPAA